MRRDVAVIGLGIAISAGAAVSMSPVWFHHLFNAGASSKSLPLSQPQVDYLVLYAELNDGFLVGKFFNRDSDVTVNKITVEAAPKDEKNVFKQFAPASFNVSAVAKPKTMSCEFRVETGLINPEFHSLRGLEAGIGRIPCEQGVMRVPHFGFSAR
jgi:hypothetical protein